MAYLGAIIRDVYRSCLQIVIISLIVYCSHWNTVLIYVPSDPLVRRKIGAFLRFRIGTNGI